MSIVERTDLPPISGDALWLMAEAFRNEWSDGVELERAFKTNIEFGITAAEQRYGILREPTISMVADLLIGGVHGGPNPEIDVRMERAIASVQKASLRSTMARSLWPLFPDETILTEDWDIGSAGGIDVGNVPNPLTLNHDVSQHRFKVGSFALVIPRKPGEFEDGPFYPSNIDFSILTVTNITGNQISFTSETDFGNDLPAIVLEGSRIYPLIESTISLGTDAELLTDSLTRVSLEVDEYVGNRRTRALAQGNTIPSGFNSHEGLPIFSPRYDPRNLASWGYSRRGTINAAGIGSAVTLYGSRGLYQINLPVITLDREEAFKLISLFDSRMGRLYPLWLAPPETTIFDFTDMDEVPPFNTLDIRTGGLQIDVKQQTHVYVRKNDGTEYIREIDSVGFVNNDEFDQFGLVMANPFPERLLAAEIEKISFAYLVRFDEDTLQERWTTTEQAEFELAFTEVENEGVISLDNIDRPETTDLVNAFITGNAGVGDLQGGFVWDAQIEATP